MAKRVLKRRMNKRAIKAETKSIKPMGKLAIMFAKFKWVFVEIAKIYSVEDSYFSKKRLESGVGFVIAEWGMIFWLITKVDVMDTYDFAIWASMQFLVAGYMVKQIQKEKEFDYTTEDSGYHDHSGYGHDRGGSDSDYGQDRTYDNYEENYGSEYESGCDEPKDCDCDENTNEYKETRKNKRDRK